jgi:hypothetical protein
MEQVKRPGKLEVRVAGPELLVAVWISGDLGQNFGSVSVSAFKMQIIENVVVGNNFLK